MLLKKIILVITFLILLSVVFAHQPRIVWDAESSYKNPIIIEDPEVSKAYYGELRGTPDFYKLESDKKFVLYINILAPLLKDPKTDFSVEVIRDRRTIYSMEGKEYKWKTFYEEFSGDDYLEGPTIEEGLSPGTYYIKVSNTKNVGKYSIAIGKKESFPIKEALKTITILPKLKTYFFEKSVLKSYINLTGVLLAAGLLILAILITLLHFLIKKLLKK